MTTRERRAAILRALTSREQTVPRLVAARLGSPYQVYDAVTTLLGDGAVKRYRRPGGIAWWYATAKAERADVSEPVRVRRRAVSVHVRRRIDRANRRQVELIQQALAWQRLHSL